MIARRRVLLVRLDSTGDVLLTGPAVRAVAAHAEVVFLAGPRGEEAARLLPGVRDVLTWCCPWVVVDPPASSATDLLEAAAAIRDRQVDEAIVFTSDHQSPLPTALVLRLAGVARITAASEDYPGSLLDVRHRRAADRHEAQANLDLAAAAGYPLPAGDDGRLAVRVPLPDVTELTGTLPYVVVHPGASAPARTWSAGSWTAATHALLHKGWRVLVTGSRSERALCAQVARPGAHDLSGRTDLAQTAAVLRGAAAVVVGNTGPAHLAAAVGTPVVSLFAPTVPAGWWAPYGVPSVVLGDHEAPCRGSRARDCPVPGHPCLESVSAIEIASAVETLCGELPCAS